VRKGPLRLSSRRKYKVLQTRHATLLGKEKEYGDLFANPYKAAERGFIDEVIRPEESRRKIIKAFAILANKKKAGPIRKHGNIPL
jgi:propionyl-CoA carboxylase beta chain